MRLWPLLPIVLTLTYATAFPQPIPVPLFGFEANAGHLPPNVRFLRRSASDQVYLTQDAVVLRNGVRIQIANVDPRVNPEGDAPLNTMYQFYEGRNPGEWRTNQRAFSAVRWNNIQPGIGARFAVTFRDGAGPTKLTQGSLTFSLQPGSDASRLQVRVLNTGGPPWDGPGGIWYSGGIITGVFIVSARAEQINGQQLRTSLPASLKVQADGALSVDMPGRDAALATEVEINFPLFDIISSSELPSKAADGNRYVVSNINQPRAFGTDSAAENDSSCGLICYDVVAARLNDAGVPIWVTVLGGRENDYASFLTAGGSGVAVMGTSGSTDFPVTANAPRPQRGSDQDTILAWLDRGSGALRNATFAGLNARSSPASATFLGNEALAGGVVETADENRPAGFLLRWNPSENRLVFVQRTESAVAAMAAAGEAGPLYVAARTRTALTVTAIDAATGAAIAGALPARVAVDIPDAYFSPETRLLPAPGGDVWIGYTIFADKPFGARTFVSRTQPLRGLVSASRLISRRPGGILHMAITPRGNLKLAVRTPDPWQATTADAEQVAGCLGSIYFAVISPAGELVYGTYAPPEGFDFDARNERPAGAPSPQARVGCVATTAGREPMPTVAPGQLATITGGGFGPADVRYYAPDSSGRFPLTADGLRVRIAGVDAPIVATARGLIAVQVPFESAQTTMAPPLVEVFENNQPLNTVEVYVSSPVLRLFDTGERNNPHSIAPLVALNQDGTVNSKSNPAAEESVVTVFGTGVGQLNPPLATGGLNPVPPAGELSGTPLLRGCLQCEILYLGSAPGLSTGVVQLNLRLQPRYEPDVVLPDGSRLREIAVSVAATLRALGVSFAPRAYLYVK